MNGKATAYWIVAAQLVLALAAGVVCFVLAGGTAGWSALAGGLIGVVTSLFVALRAIGRGTVRPAKDVLRRFYGAQAGKFFLTMALFALAIGVWQLPFPPLLLGYGLTLVVYWLALLPLNARASLG
jgi:ATP synthase protein I